MILRRDKIIEGVCRHHTEGTVVKSSSKETSISNQLLSNTDRIASYFVGKVLGTRMQMAGITNCTYPFIPRYGF
jgi:ribosomal protein L18